MFSSTVTSEINTLRTARCGAHPHLAHKAGQYMKNSGGPSGPPLFFVMNVRFWPIADLFRIINYLITIPKNSLDLYQALELIREMEKC